MPFLCGNNNLLKDQHAPARTNADDGNNTGPTCGAEDHQRPHHPKQTKTDAVRSLRTDPYGEHPLNGGKETVWQLDESDYGPEGQPPRQSKENSTI